MVERNGRPTVARNLSEKVAVSVFPVLVSGEARFLLELT